MLDQIKRHIKRQLHRRVLIPLQVAGKPKVFCIGKNKTGTTSLKAAMRELGFIVGNEAEAKHLIDDWANRNFSRLINYCKRAQFFQDFPFSFPYSYIVLDQAFKGSRFILTVRDSPEQWYDSLTRFHAKLWGKDGRVPTREDLQNAVNVYRGRPWHTHQIRGITSEDDPYNKDILIRDYMHHNESVQEYFRHRPTDLLVLNVAEKDAYKRLADFLGIETDKKEFPWENKT